MRTMLEAQYCENCGAEIRGKKSGTKFCGEECRRYWWNHHSHLLQHTYDPKPCKHCGEMFYGREQNHYCSHECYIAERFGKEKKGRPPTIWMSKQPEYEVIEGDALGESEGLSTAMIVLPEDFSEGIDAEMLPEAQRIFLVCGETSFRGKIDHFVGRIPNSLRSHLMDGDAFLFCNQTRELISMLRWQGDGFALFYKRLAIGRYPWPRYSECTIIEIKARDLELLLEYPMFIHRLTSREFGRRNRDDNNQKT